MEHQPSSQTLQLRRTNDEASFNWADESIPLPPDGLANERDAFRPQYPARAKEPAVQADVPADNTADQASEKAPTAWHAGLLPQDRGETEFLR